MSYIKETQSASDVQTVNNDSFEQPCTGQLEKQIKVVKNVSSTIPKTPPTADLIIAGS